MKETQPELTAGQLRTFMRDNDVFKIPDFTLVWCDAFLLDQMFFGDGGKYCFSDFPEVEAATEADAGTAQTQSIMINGMPHKITSAGLFTFDASEEKDDSDSSDE